MKGGWKSNMVEKVKIEKFWAVHKKTGKKWVSDYDGGDESLIVFTDGSVGVYHEMENEHYVERLTEYTLVHNFSELDHQSLTNNRVDYQYIETILEPNRNSKRKGDLMAGLAILDNYGCRIPVNKSDDFFVTFSVTELVVMGLTKIDLYSLARLNWSINHSHLSKKRENIKCLSCRMNDEV